MLAFIVSLLILSAHASVIERKELVIKNGDSQIVDETVKTNPRSFDYDFADDLVHKADRFDLYDELLNQLPNYNLYKRGQDRGTTMVPVVTRQWDTWFTQVATKNDFELKTTTPRSAPQRKISNDFFKKASENTDSKHSEVFDGKSTSPLAAAHKPLSSSSFKTDVESKSNAVSAASGQVSTPTRVSSPPWRPFSPSATSVVTALSSTASPTTTTALKKKVFTFLKKKSEERSSSSEDKTHSAQTLTAVLATNKKSLPQRLGSSEKNRETSPHSNVSQVLAGGTIISTTTASSTTAPTLGKTTTQAQLISSTTIGTSTSKIAVEPLDLGTPSGNAAAANVALDENARRRVFRSIARITANSSLKLHVVGQLTRTPQPRLFYFATIMGVRKTKFRTTVSPRPGGIWRRNTIIFEDVTTTTTMMPPTTTNKAAILYKKEHLSDDRHSISERFRKTSKHSKASSNGLRRLQNQQGPVLPSLRGTVAPKPIAIQLEARPYRGPTFNCRVLNPFTDGVASPKHDSSCNMKVPGMSSDGSCRCFYQASRRDENGCALGFVYACKPLSNKSVVV
ncbi:hypothetical protein Q1695_000086 [Nippostrongylus brasiliensis]|nr:hypothetical protein Q1695_000086 [Nippostrongylus brasiliensis]